MDVRLFNTYTGQDELLKPVHGNKVHIYNCGPTVYDYAHVGNLRSFLMYDTLRRVLEYAGYETLQMVNITDIDDKIIARARRDGVTVRDLTEEYTDVLLADLKLLNIRTPHMLPRATEHVGAMIGLIEKLLREGYAYATKDGVYFEVSKSKNYGALARLDLNAETQSRVLEEHLDKRHDRDFALWKFWTPEDGDTVYDAPFGKGRPGWHIECSAMALLGLGDTLDIHTGGADLIFPHHTNEIAQSEAITGKPFANIWLHSEFIMIDGQKMSKSLGNIITLHTIIEKGFSPIAFRYYVLGTHHKTKANFTWEVLESAETALARLRGHIGETIGSVNPQYQKRFLEIIANDLDTPRALALAWEVAKDQSLSLADRTATLLDFDKVLGLGLELRKVEIIPESIQALASLREIARKEKDWKRSDELRDLILKEGYTVLDTPTGQRIEKQN